MNLNVRGYIIVSQHVAKHSMIARRRGSIINVASIAGLSGNPQGMNTIAYNTSKGAVINFTPYGWIVDANDNFLAAMGYNKSEIVGHHHRMFVDPAGSGSGAYSEFWGRLRRGEFVAQAEQEVPGLGGQTGGESVVVLTHLWRAIRMASRTSSRTASSSAPDSTNDSMRPSRCSASASSNTKP